MGTVYLSDILAAYNESKMAEDFDFIGASYLEIESETEGE